MAESVGFLSDAFSSPWVSIPYAATSGLLSAMYPGTARAVHGVNTGLQLGMGMEKNAYELDKKKRLNEALGNYITPKPSTVYAPDTSGLPTETPGYESEKLSMSVAPTSAPAAQPMTQEKLGQVLKSIPTTGGMAPGRARDYMQMLVEAGQGDEGAKFLGQALLKEDRPPVSVRPGGALVNPSTGEVIHQQPAAAPRETTPPRPVFGTQGGEGVQSVWNPTTKQWETERRPLTSTPPRELSPEHIGDMEERRRQGRDIIDLRRQGAADSADIRRQTLEDRKAARELAAATLSQTERERTMTPKSVAEAKDLMARDAADMKLNSLPFEAAKKAWEDLAESYGLELTGIPTIGYVKGEKDWFSNTPVLKGKFSMRPKSITTKTTKGKQPVANPGRLKFDSSGNLVP